MMPYRKISEDIPNVYKELGFQNIDQGYIPSESEFIKIVKEYYKSNYRKKNFSPIDFASKVREVVKDLHHRVLSGTGKAEEHTRTKIRSAKENVVFLNALVKEKEGLIEELRKNPKHVAEILKDGIGKYKVRVTLPGGEAEDLQRSGDLYEHDKINKLITGLNLGLPEKIDTPEDLNQKNEYMAAVNFLRKLMSNDITEAKQLVKKYETEAIRLENSLKHLGKPAEKVVTKMVGISPIIDVQTVSFPEHKQEEETRVEHKQSPYLWLLRRYPSKGDPEGAGYADVILRNILKGLTKEERKDLGLPEETPERQPLRIKKDIYRIVEKFADEGGTTTEPERRKVEEAPPGTIKPGDKPALLRKKVFEEISSLTGSLSVLSKETKMLLSGLEKFLGKDSTEQAFDVVPQPVYYKYREFIKDLKKSLPENEFKDLTRWNVRDNFVINTGDLPIHLQPHRERMETFFKQISEKINDNYKRYGDEWKDVIDTIEELKKSLSLVRRFLSNMKRDVGFERIRKGKPPAIFTPYKKHAGTHEGLSGALASAKNSIVDMVKFIKDHLIPVETSTGQVLRQRNPEEFMALLKEGDKLDQYLDEFMEKLNSMQSKVETYFDRSQRFNEGIMDVSGLRLKESPAPSTVKAADYMRRMAFFMKIQAAVDMFRSEFTKILPQLWTTGKNPNIMYDYFSKSYPAEELIRGLHELSTAGDSEKQYLNYTKFKEMIGHTKGEFDRELDRAVKGSHEELQGLLAKKENAVKEMSELSLGIDKNKDEFSKRFKELLETAENLEEMDKRRKDSLKSLNSKRIEMMNQIVDTFGNVEEFDKSKASQLMKDMNNTVADIRDTIGGLGQTQHPTTGKQISAEHLGEEMSRAWHTYENEIAKARNRIVNLEDQQMDINNHVVSFKKIAEQGFSEKARVRLWKLWVLYMWNQIDEHWAKKAADFQAYFNVNFQDYIDIHNEVKKITGGSVYSRAARRLLEDIKKQRQYMRQKNQMIPGNLDSIEKALDGMVQVPHGEVEKAASNLMSVIYDFPSIYSFNVCMASVGMEKTAYKTDMELLLR